MERAMVATSLDILHTLKVAIFKKQLEHNIRGISGNPRNVLPHGLK